MNSLYFHGAQEVRKIEAMKLNQRICLSLSISGEDVVEDLDFAPLFLSSVRMISPVLGS